MELVAGQAIDPVEQPAITRESLRAYAEASGDPNPIHLDDSVARRMGLPGIIAHGMLIASFVAERARRLAGDGWEIRQFQTRFKAMTLLGEKILVGGAVKSADGAQAVLELEARNDQGEIKTTSVVRLRRKE